MPELSSRTTPRVDETVALRDELRQWRLALGWWSGLPAQEAYDFWKQSTGKETDR